LLEAHGATIEFLKAGLKTSEIANEFLDCQEWEGGDWNAEVELMNSIKSVLTTLAAVLIGVAIGMFLTQPPKVKASTIFHIQRVTAGSNLLVYDDYVGFACTQQDCYVVTR